MNDLRTKAVLVLGAGKIGRMIARLLTTQPGFRVTIADRDPSQLQRAQAEVAEESLRALTIDVVRDFKTLREAAEDSDSVVCAIAPLPNAAYHVDRVGRGDPVDDQDGNPVLQVARAAKLTGAHYFDLTEDVSTTARVLAIAASKRGSASRTGVFVPQCGLAPGFVSIVAVDLARRLEEEGVRIESVRLRVGALPRFPEGLIKYNLTWSIDGLIGEYCNPCDAIRDGKVTQVAALEGLEPLVIQGRPYEAFNTAGGVGSLCDYFWRKGARQLDYKTIRYPGHRDLMHLLLNELNLREDLSTLRRILKRAIPETRQDEVVTYCSVTGRHLDGDELLKCGDARRISSCTLPSLRSAGGARTHWSAIQLTTASALCAVMDMVLSEDVGHRQAPSILRQEEVGLDRFLANRFGEVFRDTEISGVERREAPTGVLP